MPMVHDSGDYPALLETALKRAGYADFRARQRAARAQGRRLGIGVAAYNEATGIGPHEGAHVEVGAGGGVSVTVGAPSQGQGHETTLAQICADRPVFPGVGHRGGRRHRALSASSGTYASRVAVVVGNDVAAAASAVNERVRRVASRALGASGRRGHRRRRCPRARRSARVVDLVMIHAVSARTSSATSDGPAATRYHSPERDLGLGRPRGHGGGRRRHGRVTLPRTTAHDAGHDRSARGGRPDAGGAVQGIGMALTEEVVYGGQAPTGTLMDHAPRADSVRPSR
jgi:carbon-monoxide dehydrogenase large subunit